MNCPFLEELIVAYCGACQVKKMIPKDQLTAQNPCEADYHRCPIFQEFLAKQKKEAIMAEKANQEDVTSEKEKPCIWMKAGVVAYRMCTRNYDCKNCEFDQAITDQSGAYVESPLVAQAIEKLRQLPASERKCRYMLTGDFTYKLCPNNYECWHCAVDQYVQDTIDADPYLQKRRARAAQKEEKVKGFTLRKDVYYLPNHIWIRVEGELVKVGIDDFAARLIGKIENIDFTGKTTIAMGDECWRLGSENRMVSMSLPMHAEIVEKNDSLQSDPALIRQDPYNRGWLLKIKSAQEMGDMMKSSKARDWLAKEFEKLHQEFEESIGVTITDGGEVAEDLHERLTDEEWHELVKRFL